MDTDTDSGLIEPFEIPLRKTVNFRGVEYKAITLREPTAGEIEKAMGASNNVGVGIKLIALVGALPEGAVSLFSQRDFQECNDYLLGFTSNGRPIGGA